MKSLLIIGAGDYGQLVKELAETCCYEKIDFLDDNSLLAVGKVDHLETIQRDYDGAIVAIGNPAIRKKIFERVENPVTLIHPSAVISISAEIGKGCVVEANAVINVAACVEDGSYVCAGAVINHNAAVHKFCQIDCNSVVKAGAEVPEGTKTLSCTVWKKKPEMPVGEGSFF